MTDEQEFTEDMAAIGLPLQFGEAAGQVYISAVLAAREPGMVGYEHLHEVGMTAMEAWFAYCADLYEETAPEEAPVAE